MIFFFSLLYDTSIFSPTKICESTTKRDIKAINSENFKCHIPICCYICIALIYGIFLFVCLTSFIALGDLICMKLVSHASKVMFKILQARQYVNRELSDVQVGFREEPEIRLPTPTGSWKKQESSRKTSISALLTMPKPLTVWITINCGKF